MVPKILHQIFISNDKIKKFPDEWSRFSKKAISLHKDWEYIFWDKERLYHFIQEHYPKFTPYFTEEIPFVVQSDIGRYVILQHMGGWYFDCDYEIIKPLDIWQDNDLILPYERDTTDPIEPTSQIGNSILASISQHWFWDYILQELPPPTFFIQNTHHDDIIANTGPKKITHVFNTLTDAQKNNISCPGRNQFHFPTLHHMSAQEYAHIISLPDIYGIHHTHSSWRDHELLKNIRRRKFYAHPIGRPLIQMWEKYLSLIKGTKK